MIGPLEILALIFVVFVILGPKRITNMAKSLGKGATDFVGQLGSPKPEEPKDSPKPPGELPPGTPPKRKNSRKD